MKRILTILLLLPAFVFGQTATQQKDMSTYPPDTTTSSYINSITVFANKNGTYYNYKLYDLIKSKADVTHTHPIANVTGLQTALNSKFDIPVGTTSQYLTGNGTLATFPTIPAQVNIIAGTNITKTGTYPNITISSTATGGGTVYATDVVTDANHQFVTATERSAIGSSSSGTSFFYDVANYGAIPDDNLDDTHAYNEALRAAIRTAISVPGSTNTVGVVRGGTYHFDSTIMLGDPAIAFSTVRLVAMQARPYDAGTQAMKGVTLKSRTSTQPLISVHTQRDGSIENFNIEGINTISQTGGFGVDVASNYVSASMLAANSNADSRDLSYAGIAIDPFVGDGVTQSYDGIAHTAAASSGFRIINCNIRHFVTGLGVQIFGRGDANGDFVTVRDCAIKNNKYAISCGNSQSRQLNVDNCQLDENYIALVDNVHGKQQGRFNRQLGGHVSGFQWFSFGDMARTETFLAQGIYAESLQILGTAEGGSGAGPIVIDNCKLSLSHQQSTLIPTYIFSGNSIIIRDSKITGADIDLKCTKDPVIENSILVTTRDGVNQAYANVFSRDFNTISATQQSIWNKMYERVPQMVGPAMSAIVRNSISNFGDVDFSYNERSIGIPQANKIDLPSVPVGTSGLVGDYLYRSKSNAPSALLNRTLDSTLLRFSLNGSSWSDFLTPTLAAPGDIIYNTKDGAKFMIIRKGTRSGTTGLVVQSSDNTGSDFDAILLNGFKFNGTTGNFYQYFGIDPTTMWTGSTVYWFSANHHKTRALKGTTSTASATITGIDWGKAADDNASQPGGPTGQFKVGDILYAVNTNGVLNVATSDVQTLRVMSINSTSSITVDANLNFSSSNVLLYSIYPFK
jgi:hypothetical protein